MSKKKEDLGAECSPRHHGIYWQAGLLTVDSFHSATLTVSNFRKDGLTRITVTCKSALGPLTSHQHTPWIKLTDSPSTLLEYCPQSQWGPMQSKWFTHGCYFPHQTMRSKTEGHKSCSFLSSQCLTQFLPHTCFHQIFLELNQLIILLSLKVILRVQYKWLKYIRDNYIIKFSLNWIFTGDLSTGYSNWFMTFFKVE